MLDRIRSYYQQHPRTLHWQLTVLFFFALSVWMKNTRNLGEGYFLMAVICLPAGAIHLWAWFRWQAPGKPSGAVPQTEDTPTRPVDSPGQAERHPFWQRLEGFTLAIWLTALLVFLIRQKMQFSGDSWWQFWDFRKYGLENGWLSWLSYVPAFLTFWIPLSLQNAFRQWVEIPGLLYKLWFYTPIEVNNYEEINLVPVVFQVSRRVEKNDIITEPKELPRDKNLGYMFHYFLEWYNKRSSKDYPIKPCEEIGYDDQPWGWVLYEKPSFRTFFLRRYLDTDRTVAANKIKPRTVILAKRVNVTDDRQRPPVENETVDEQRELPAINLPIPEASRTSAPEVTKPNSLDNWGL